MKKLTLIGIAAVGLVVFFARQEITIWLGVAKVVHFADAKLEAAVRHALEKPKGPITDKDLEGLTSLYLDGLTDLRGIKHCPNLESLELANTPEIDLHPLSNLSKLQSFELDVLSPSQDYGPVRSLTNLRRLDLPNQYWEVGQLADLSFLRRLTKLERLNLHGQEVGDITLLSGLTHVKGLDLSSNQVGDISPLTNLTNLKVLDLSSNQITDITPLSNLTNLRGLWLSDNQISGISPLTGLSKLVILDLGGNQVGDISPLSGLTSLWCLFLGSNRIGDVNPLANLTDLRFLTLEHNRIQSISPLVTLAAKRMDPALVRKREDRDWIEIASKETEGMHGIPVFGTGLKINLRGNPLNDEAYEVHIPALERHTWHEGTGAWWSYDSLRQQTGVQVWFHPKPSGEVITFSDQEVEAAIRKVLEIPEEWRPIYPSDLLGVRDLELGGKNASDISWIQHCINLESLNLQLNRITDIAPLGKLSKLRMLDLSSNRISDISSLRSLTELRVLHLDNNLIEDISAVQSLTKVGMGGSILLRQEGIKVQLGLSNNQISDISPLVRNSGIGKQDQVDLRGNPLSEDSVNKLIPELQKRGVEVLHDKRQRE